MRALVVLDLKAVDGAPRTTDDVIAALEPELDRMTFEVNGVATSTGYEVSVVKIEGASR